MSLNIASAVHVYTQFNWRWGLRSHCHLIHKRAVFHVNLLMCCQIIGSGFIDPFSFMESLLKTLTNAPRFTGGSVAFKASTSHNSINFFWLIIPSSSFIFMWIHEWKPYEFKPKLQIIDCHWSPHIISFLAITTHDLAAVFESIKSFVLVCLFELAWWFVNFVMSQAWNVCERIRCCWIKWTSWEGLMMIFQHHWRTSPNSFFVCWSFTFQGPPRRQRRIIIDCSDDAR